MGLVFFQQLSNGIIKGSIYSLIAVGLSLIFGIMGLINFAHGELYMLGAYVAFFACSLFHLPPIISLFVSMAVVFGVGMIIEGTAIHHMRQKKSPLLYVILLTFGISIFLQNLVLIVWGATYKRNPPILKGAFSMGPIIQSNQRVLVLVIALLIMITVYLVIKKTKLGRAIRATAQSLDAAVLMGINVDRVYMLTFGIAAALAAAAGSLIAPMFYIYPTMGVSPVLKAFVIVILGGLGSIGGAVLGGFIIGIAESLTAAYISSQYEAAVAFGLMMALLIFKPSGLFGKHHN